MRKKSPSSGGQVLTELSKAFDCIDHKLLIAKLYAYYFDRNSLYYVHSYSRQDQQRTKVTNTHMTLADTLCKMLEGTIVGLLLFEICICIFFYGTDHLSIANNADESSPYDCLSVLSTFLQILQKGTKHISKRFLNNHLICNPGKCHFITSSKADDKAKDQKS